MANYIETNKNFTAYAQHTYAMKKETIDFMEKNGDILEKALATLIKKYAGGEVND